MGAGNGSAPLPWHVVWQRSPGPVQHVFFGVGSAFRGLQPRIPEPDLYDLAGKSKFKEGRPAWAIINYEGIRVKRRRITPMNASKTMFGRILDRPLFRS